MLSTLGPLPESSPFKKLCLAELPLLSENAALPAGFYLSLPLFTPHPSLFSALFLSVAPTHLCVCVCVSSFLLYITCAHPLCL